MVDLSTKDKVALHQSIYLVGPDSYIQMAITYGEFRMVPLLIGHVTNLHGKFHRAGKIFKCIDNPQAGVIFNQFPLGSEMFFKILYLIER